MPRTGRNRRETAIQQEEGNLDMTANMQIHSQNAYKRELERNKSPQQAQAEHDAGMNSSPSQKKALEAIDNAADQTVTTIDAEIVQKENEISELRQKRAGLLSSQAIPPAAISDPGDVDLSTSKDEAGNDLDTDLDVVNKNAPVSKHHSSKSQSSKS